MNCVVGYFFRLHLMLHACIRRFDVTGNLEIFWKLNTTYVCIMLQVWCPSYLLHIYESAAGTAVDGPKEKSRTEQHTPKQKYGPCLVPNQRTRARHHKTKVIGWIHPQPNKGRVLFSLFIYLLPACIYVLA